MIQPYPLDRVIEYDLDRVIECGKITTQWNDPKVVTLNLLPFFIK